MVIIDICKFFTVYPKTYSHNKPKAQSTLTNQFIQYLVRKKFTFLDDLIWDIVFVKVIYLFLAQTHAFILKEKTQLHQNPLYWNSIIFIR